MHLSVHHASICPSIHPFTLSIHPFTLSIHPFTLSIHPFRVQQELMTHLIASLDNNDNPITTSPTASSSCNTTDTEDVTVTELVRNILLQETLTLLLQKEEKSEFKKEYDGEDEGHYDFSSFETDVSSTTPLSTPHPTPPQSPVPMEQAPPTEPVLITPVSSLSNILENITDKDDNISTPEVSILMVAILAHGGKY